MTENPESASHADVRILTLRRWNFPQTTRLFPTKGISPAAGDYISYDSHHFIHIEVCDKPPVQPICRAYQGLQALREKQRDSEERDTHMVQTLTLLANDGSFWDTPGNVLYISFLQLTNAAVIPFEDVQKQIGSIIAKQAPGASWALYHSLDFCDYVLFTRDLTYDVCSRILWDLTIVRSREFAVLRDSFTVCGFHPDFLKDSFQKLDRNEYPDWQEHTSLSVQLSIQSWDVWEDFENRLKQTRIPYRTMRTFGRYDIRLVMDNLSGGQILQLLHLLDTMASRSEDSAFGGYEISMEAPWNHAISGKAANATQNRALEKAALGAMKSLCTACAQANPDSSDYVEETRRSLEALLKNGFSEEFVLSVLPTFLSYLQITIDVQNYLEQMELEEDEWVRLKESHEKMTRHYFNALNTLALCTMHNERRFVQAPAFNVTYFDVPPKLLAFYSAVAQQIQDILKSETDADYHFLFVPNYQKDINVRTLELDMEYNLPQHLAVAHLQESYFYDPAQTIRLFCHEAAHYLSDRHRKDRAKHIFRVISFLLLANTPLCHVAEEKESNSLLVVMADALADYLLIKFDQQTLSPTRGILFHLRDISDFLRNNDYGIRLFYDTFDTDAIRIRWQKALRDGVREEPDTFGTLFSFALSRIQETLQSDYLVELFHQDPEGMYVYEVFSQIIAHYASFTNGQEPDKEFFQICENVLQAFSEAYADLRMSELIGEEFSIHWYEEMLMQLGAVSPYQKRLRHDAVLTVIKPDDNWKPLQSFCGSDPQLVSYATEQLCGYLKLCHSEPIRSQYVVGLLRTFKSGDIDKQCNRIREEIQRNRGYLTECCRRISLGHPSEMC